MATSFDALRDLYHQCSDGKRQPLEHEVNAVLDLMLNSVAKTFIVIDALDECCERQRLLDFVQRLLQHHATKLHLFAASRNEQDISRSMTTLKVSKIDIQSDVVNEDIRAYIDQQLQSDVRLRLWKPLVQDEIRAKLMEKADGMFRWVFCQIESIRPCVRLPKLRTALASLPLTLDETYHRILQQITENGYLEDAICILQWLCYSIEPLTLEELSEVLAIDRGAGEFDVDSRVRDADDLLVICSSLVIRQVETTPSSERNYLKLAHLSVREFLLASRLSHYRHFQPVETHRMIVESALIYISHVCKLDAEHFKSTDYDDTLLRYPLMKYCSIYWSEHWRLSDRCLSAICSTSIQYLFMESLPIFKLWTHFVSTEMHWGNHDGFGLQLARATEIGCDYAMQMLLNAGASVQPGVDIRYPLGFALDGDHIPAVQLLLNAGADINRYKGHLDDASRRGSMSVVRFLIDVGVNLNTEENTKALFSASQRGHDKIVSLLIEAGVDVNADIQQRIYHYSPRRHQKNTRRRRGYIDYDSDSEDDAESYVEKWSERALYTACKNGYEQVVRLLVDAGADVNYVGDRCALSAAVANGNAPIVKIFAEAGADLDRDIKSHGTPLVKAVIAKLQSMVETLIRIGVDVNDRGRGRPLKYAASGGNEVVVSMLLDAGASPDIQEAETASALSEAAYHGHTLIVTKLIDAGADPRYAWRGTSVLEYAAFRGSTVVIQSLIDAGAEVDCDSSDAYRSLCIASSEGHHEIVDLLLRHDVNINYGQVTANCFMNPLNSAVLGSYNTVARKLIDAKADLNTRHVPYSHIYIEGGCSFDVNRGEHGVIPLGFAAMNGNETAVRLLIDAGADLNLRFDSCYGPSRSQQPGHFHTALSIAAQRGHFSVVSILIDAGADLQCWLENVGGISIALKDAVFHGSQPVMRKLIALGADINSEVCNDFKRMPAWAWSILGNDNEDTVQALVDLGANVNEAVWDVNETHRHTPLVLAVQESRLEVVRILVAAGANVNAHCLKGNVEKTVMFYAVGTWRPAKTGIIVALIDAGADVNATFTFAAENYTPLSYLISNPLYDVVDHMEIIEKLKVAGAKTLEELTSEDTILPSS